MTAPGLGLGLDIGGTNFRIATFAADGLVPLHVHKEEVGEARDPASIVERIAAAAERLVGGTDDVTMGVGIAAMLRDRQGTVARSPHLRWRDVAFGRQLAARLGTRYSIGVYNDVNAIVWGETVAGAARGCRDVLGVYVGTGIGGGVVADGQLVEGASNCAGEIGHTKVRWDDDAAPCACGQRGCIEAYLGGSYVAKRIAAELAAGAKSSAVGIAGSIDEVMASHVDQAAAEGDEWALELWSELAPLLGVVLANAAAVLNPERLVLGGGMLSRTPLLYDLVVTALTVAAPVAIMETLDVVPAELGDEAGLVGAAALARDGVSLVKEL
ncbi:MAG: ROK family protein [Deltaproteobacteria bacterium]|nr:ROK family protein [Deltaproteobacteria bacterium]